MRTALLFILLFGTACQPWTPIQSSPTVVRDYELGQVDSTRVGEAIFDIQAGQMVPTFRAVRDHDPKVRGLPKIPAMLQMRAAAEHKDGDIVIHNEGWHSEHGIVVDRTGVVTGWHTGYGLRRNGTWPSEPLFEPSVIILQDLPGAFRAELIYSGVSGNTLRATYREYVDDFIRPAFNQELQFDLAQSRQIGFRTVRVEVVEATNSVLRYRVLEDEGLPWWPMQ